MSAEPATGDYRQSPVFWGLSGVWHWNVVISKVETGNGEKKPLLALFEKKKKVLFAEFRCLDRFCDLSPGATVSRLPPSRTTQEALTRDL